jgi:hypothetical protein
VRYGLGNDSKKVGDAVKSSDLVGWRMVVITPDMVGKVIAQFVSLECKHEDWKFNPNDETEAAQKRWIDLVKKDGGHAAFISDPDQVI